MVVFYVQIVTVNVPMGYAVPDQKDLHLQKALLLMLYLTLIFEFEQISFLAVEKTVK